MAEQSDLRKYKALADAYEFHLTTCEPHRLDWDRERRRLIEDLDKQVKAATRHQARYTALETAARQALAPFLASEGAPQTVAMTRLVALLQGQDPDVATRATKTQAQAAARAVLAHDDDQDTWIR